MTFYQTMQYVMKTRFVWNAGENAVKRSMYGLVIVTLIKVGNFGVIANIVKQKHFINVLKYRGRIGYENNSYYR